LFESERSFRLLVEGVADYALYMLDPTGIITSWNIGGQRIKGYSAGEILGQHFSRFYTDAERTGRLAVGAVGFGVEAGEVLADDLLGRIALDALAADIPTGDDAGRVQHI